MSEEVEPKKKRRQNVACDSCKFRRIKCDLVNLLCPPELIDDPPPLSKLVLENPGVSCSNCKNKGLDCTTSQILNPSKPNKGGKRIEEARKKFGSASVDNGDDLPLDPGSSSRASLPLQFPQMDYTQQLPDGTADGMFGMTVPSQGIPSTTGMPMDPLPNMDDLQAWTTLFASTPPIGDGLTHPNMPFDASALNQSGLNPLPPEFQQFLHPSTSSSAPAASNPTGGDMYTLPTQEMAPLLQNISAEGGAATWQLAEPIRTPVSRFSAPPTQATTNIVTPAASEHELLDEHVTRASSSSVVGGHSYLSQGSKTILPHTTYSDPVPGMLSTAPSPDRWAGRPQSSSSDSSRSWVDSTSRPIQPPPAHWAIEQILNKRKRNRGDFMELPLSKEEAWRVWSRDPATGYEARWGRLELVQEKLADRALGIELSRHLIKVFFQAVYFSFPAISPEAFYLEWVRADERSDRMTPAQEALCACIEAWGARYSDSPVILGLEPDREKDAPKVITADGKFLPGTQARLHWGKARQGVCNALMVRAKRLLDDHGIFRKPSITGFQAMLLYHQLQHTDTRQALSHEHWMEVQMVHSALAEQMEILNLTWTSTLPMPHDEREIPLPAPQQRIRQRRLYFGFIVGDAYYAAAAGRPPRIDQEDLEAAESWLKASVDALPPSGLRCLAISMRLYLRLAKVGRRIANELACPSQKKGTILVPEMCRVVREVWAEIKSILTDISVEFGQSLETCPEPIVGFSPLSYLVNIRLGAPFFLLVIHQLIREQIEFRKQLVGSYIVDERGNGSSPQHDNISSLETLRLQGVDVMLQICRSEAAMLATLVPSGMLQSASIFTGVVIAMGQFLAEVPVNEQGYPSDTLGGYGWTWKQKQEDMGHCTDTLHQMGWSWPEVKNILDHIHLAMERMQPTPEQLAGYSPHSNPTWNVVATQQDKIRAFESQTMSLAMQYWPPLSLSDLARRSFASSHASSNLDPRRIESRAPVIQEISSPPAEQLAASIAENKSSPLWQKLMKDPWVDALKSKGADRAMVFGPGAQAGSEDQSGWYETALRALDTMDARHAASRSASGSAENSPSSHPATGSTRSQTPEERPIKMPRVRQAPHSTLSHELNGNSGPVLPETKQNGHRYSPILPTPQSTFANEPVSREHTAPQRPVNPLQGMPTEGSSWAFDFADLANAPPVEIESPGETMRAFESFLQGITDPEQPLQS